MEVTRDNFESVLENLPKVVENAQFFTIDAEFTGLRVDGESNVNYFDDLEDLYLKYKLKADTFMALQIGLAAFFYDEENDRYTHCAYNFYVYPSSHSDVSFTCQSRSIKFLSSFGFDFNKLFNIGVPYLRREEAESLVRRLEEKYERDCNLEKSTKMNVPDEFKSTIRDILEKINNVLETDRKRIFKIERYNSFIRKLIYNAVFQEFGSTVFLETNKDETITVSVGLSAEEIKKKQEEKFLNEKKEINNEVGFCKVINMLILSKKTIIGHNFLLDLLFIIRQFVVPLPGTYKEFIELINFAFPKIIDTKYMASSEMKDVKDTSLSNLVEHLKKMKAVPEVGVDEVGAGYSIAEEKFHEAAFDAYLTGLGFLAMVKCIGNANCVSNVYKNLSNSPLLDSVINKLSIPRLHDIYNMNLEEYGNEPDRTGVYHLTFPREWIREDINDLFCHCGLIQVAWINSTAAYVKVKKEYIGDVESSLMKSGQAYKLLSYREYKSLKNSTTESEEKTEKRPMTPSSSPSTTPTSSGSVKRKKFEEDIGEVIERPQKKLCS